MEERQVQQRPVVLVVEDEPLLPMFASDMVEDAGFEAVEAADDTEAIKILETRYDIRVVFTDIDMPRSMDGMMLAAALRDRWPPIQIILTSEHLLAEDVRMAPRSVFFAKPYVVERVVETMRQMAAGAVRSMSRRNEQ